MSIKLLSVNETITLPLKTQKVLVKNRGNISLQKQAQHLIIRARKQGQTTLIIADKTYQIYILNFKTKKACLKLETLLSKLWGLHWVLEDGRIKVQGRLHRFSDWMDLARFAKDYGISYHFLALPSEEMAKQANLYFQSLFQNNSYQFIWSDLPKIRLPLGFKKNIWQNKLKHLGLQAEVEPVKKR